MNNFLNDNNKNSNKVKSKNFSDKKLNKFSLSGYPDKFTQGYNMKKNSTIFSWELKSIAENDYQKISIDMPLFNKKCRKLVRKFIF